ncbi:MAG: hypothetical protein V4584_15905 [Verrucomicrobiota bacterium]
MNPRQKLTLTAAGLLLLALSVVLWPSSRQPVPSAGSSERSRPVNRAPKPVAAPLPPRRAKDFQTFAKLAAKDQFPKLTRQEIDTYLEAQHRSAGSLLAAFRLIHDEALLREAMEKFPHDPQVQLASLQITGDPAKRLEILESFKLSNPGNGLGNGLAAQALLDLGKTEEAFAELSQSIGKPFDEMTLATSQNEEEAYLSAGFSPVEAKMAAMNELGRPLVINLRKIADHLKALRGTYAAAGDDAAVQATRDIQTGLGLHLQSGGGIVDEMVGMVFENGALKGVDTPEARARLAELKLQNQSMVDKARKIPVLMENPAVPESDWLLYFDRAKLFGEKAANDWMLEKYPGL